MALSIGLLILRLATGLLMFGHGAQKLFGWFGGRGIQGTIGMMNKLHLRPAPVWAWLAALTETVGGLLFALGLLDPLGSLGIIAAMLMAMITVTWPRFWGSQGGLEYNLLFVIPAVVEVFTGAGTYSLDHLLGIALPEPVSFLVGLLLVIIGIGVALFTRQSEQAAATPSVSTGD